MIVLPISHHSTLTHRQSLRHYLRQWTVVCKYTSAFPPQQLKILRQLFKILGVEIKIVGEQ